MQISCLCLRKYVGTIPFGSRFFGSLKVPQKQNFRLKRYILSANINQIIPLLVTTVGRSFGDNSRIFARPVLIKLQVLLCAYCTKPQLGVQVDHVPWRLNFGVSTCPWSCLFQVRQNQIFVVANVSKVVFSFGCLAQFFRCSIDAGTSSFFRLCCWLWVAGAWALVLIFYPPVSFVFMPFQSQGDIYEI